MKTKRRDNFSSSVIKTIERRVNAKCSNPDCRVPTSGPTVNPDKANNVGIAAHITAAAPGGPRYDGKITAHQRAGIDNAIWLCANCATKIDKDADRYDIDLLNKWKKKAEEDAYKEFGKTPVSRRDHAALKALAFGGLRKTELSDAVSRICNLTATEMEQLDPRFAVDVGYRAGTTSFTLNPIQPVNVSMKVAEDFVFEFETKYSDLVKHGSDLEIDTKAVKFMGSPLFEFQGDLQGKLVISTNVRKPAVLKCTFERKDGTRQVDDIHGELVGGVESVTFNGSAFGGLMKFTQSFFTDPRIVKSCPMSVEIDLASWYERPMRALPYFNKAYEFYESIKMGDKMLALVEIDGMTAFSAGGTFNCENPKGDEYYFLLRHIRNVRSILELLGLDVNFSEKNSITAEEAEFVEQIYQMFFCQQKLKDNKVATATFSMSILPNTSESQINQICESANPIRIAQKFKMPINLWGLIIELPQIIMTYTMATLKKLSPAGKIKAGNSYRFRISPLDDCQLIVEFAKE
ncbi:hypothetical protein H8K47_00060 [Undibacterium sp. CY7W]|uniref:HNH endonuclease n=1 Tax=Undibacterium rugosum TaxID=2762291 RepID=A0A923HYN9_9BURK|nr:hypothetical protein [Undibacterium rugosum]MBC3933737.1 hypothetical protein [Undibacterium rugosum]